MFTVELIERYTTQFEFVSKGEFFLYEDFLHVKIDGAHNEDNAFIFDGRPRIVSLDSYTRVYPIDVRICEVGK